MPYKLSPSSLALIKECKRCFWLTNNNIWKRPAGIFPSLPSGMDKILKVHFDKYMEKGLLPPELQENKECKGCKLFDDKEKLKIWQSNFKGLSFTDEEGNNIHGAIDNLLVKDGKIIVLDYKTRGFPLKEDTAEHYQHQLDIYNFLLRKNGYKTEDYAFLLFYVPKEVLSGGEVLFDTTLVKMKTNEKDAENMWKNALKLLKEECPKESCEWCCGVR